MRNLRRQVTDNNVFRWAGMLLSEAGKLMAARPWQESKTEEPRPDAVAVL
jgi:hypothetical protein